jgi:hypothetical protein
MTISEILSVCALLVAIAGIAFTALRTRRAEALSLRDSVVRLNTIAELQKALASEGHKPSPDHAEEDKLREELRAGTLTNGRRDRLKDILQGHIDDPEVQLALKSCVVSDEEKKRIQDSVNNNRLLLATIPIVAAAERVVKRGAEAVAKAEMTKDHDDKKD